MNVLNAWVERAMRLGPLAFAMLAALVFARLSELALLRVLAPYRVEGRPVQRLGWAWLLLWPLLGAALLGVEGRVPTTWVPLVNKALLIAVTITAAVVVARVFRWLEDIVFVRLYQRAALTDPLDARRLRTQLDFVRKLALVFVVLVATAVVLMSFTAVRQLGTSLLASAGIAGIVVGVAAQKTLGNLFAGIQIAFTQPIRIDDDVVIEGEWGTVEELTLTYVVVRLWDLRRLILPIAYLTEKPFQNWTRRSANLIGSVFLFTDFSAPLDELRAELTRLVSNHPLWDGKVMNLQVTDITEQSVQLRALVSGRNAGELWDLRCSVREGLLRHLQSAAATSLPRRRTQITAGTLPR